MKQDPDYYHKLVAELSDMLDKKQAGMSVYSLFEPERQKLSIFAKPSDYTHKWDEEKEGRPYDPWKDPMLVPIMSHTSENKFTDSADALQECAKTMYKTQLPKQLAAYIPA